MKTILFTATVALLALSGCVAPGHYPISGETCAPTDPVLKLEPSACLPAK
jgi:hypothetical protein